MALLFRTSEMALLHRAARWPCYREGPSGLVVEKGDWSQRREYRMATEMAWL